MSALVRVLRAHAAPLLAIAVVTLVAALLAGAVLPLLGALATAGTRADLDRATARERDLEATFALVAQDAFTSPEDGQQTFAGVQPSLVAIQRSMPTALRAATGRPGWVATTRPLSLDGLPSKVPASVALATDPGFVDRVRFTQGQAPRAAADGSTLEVALSPAVARAIGWRVGDVRTTEGTTLRLSGVWEPRDRDDPAWAHTPTTLRPATTGNASGGVDLTGTAYTAVDDFGVLAASGRPVQGRAWIPIRSDAVTVANRSAIVDDTRRFLTTRAPLPTTPTRVTTFSTDLPALLTAAAARDTTVATLSAALGAGPAGALVALGVLLARLVLDRAGPRLRLLAARGASGTTTRSVAAALVAVAAVPGAVVGALLAALVQRLPLGPVTPSTVDVLVGAALAVAVPCVAVAVQAPSSGMRADVATGSTGSARRAPVRLVVEGIVVVAALAAAVVTVRTGVTTTAPGGSVDPLAAVLPLLLAAVGVVLALRVLPVALRRVVARGHRRRGSARLVGGATAARDAAGQAVPLVVAVIGIAVALFSTVVGSTLEGGVAEAARRSVAADVSVSAPALDADQVARITRVPGVAAAAGVSTTGQLSLDTPQGSVSAVVLVADTRALAAVQRGVPGAVPLPASLRERVGGRIPLLASGAVAAVAGRDPSVLATDVRVVGSVEAPVPFTTAERWVLLDDRFANDLTDSGSVDRVLVRTDPGAHPERVAAAIRGAVQVDTVTTAVGTERVLDADPRIPGTRVVALAAAALGGLLGIGALVVSALLAGRRRRERARLLDVFGLDPAGVRAVVVVETLPLLVASLVTGVVVAVGTVALTLLSADLRSFTGSTVRPGVVVDPFLLGAVVLGVLVALAGVLALAVRTGTPRRPHTDPAPPRRSA